jgi:hypothetical protein
MDEHSYRKLEINAYFSIITQCAQQQQKKTKAL